MCSPGTVAPPPRATVCGCKLQRHANLQRAWTPVELLHRSGSPRTHWSGSHGHAAKGGAWYRPRLCSTHLYQPFAIGANGEPPWSHSISGSSGTVWPLLRPLGSDCTWGTCFLFYCSVFVCVCLFCVCVCVLCLRFVCSVFCVCVFCLLLSFFCVILCDCCDLFVFCLSVGVFFHLLWHSSWTIGNHIKKYIPSHVKV